MTTKVDWNKLPPIYREHECRNGHVWTGKVVLSPHTERISGEVGSYCPECGLRACSSSPWIDENGIGIYTGKKETR